MPKKQHQLDRERSSGHIDKALCGRDMPPGESTWGFESCERCASVARARKDRKDRETLQTHGDGTKYGHATKKSSAQLDREVREALAPHAASGDRVVSGLANWGIDRGQVDEVRALFRAGDHRRAVGLARDLGWNRASKRGRAFR